MAKTLLSTSLGQIRCYDFYENISATRRPICSDFRFTTSSKLYIGQTFINELYRTCNEYFSKSLEFSPEQFIVLITAHYSDCVDIVYLYVPYISPLWKG